MKWVLGLKSYKIKNVLAYFCATMDRYAFGCVFPMASIYGFCVVIIISTLQTRITQ
ncbi:hypothetical protein HPHPA9_0294 [Helicobacter pylori Hp A-9]|uniref:Uncharacterized protein n=1 Tax=Helicobacter pylori Hp A-9 TaxID=992034 RepID=I9RF27_HELPX|nr:hypothetical protein HPHPA9_0294 [Helicobacter pylori Hp A-9]